MLSDIHLHMQELIDIINGKASPDKDWFDRVQLFVDNLKTWKPEIFVMLNEGKIEYIVSNSEMHLNVFNYNDEMETAIEPEEFEKKFLAWKHDLEDGINKGYLKKIL